jgi:DNA-binding NarL/FixJ family response regulator
MTPREREVLTLLTMGYSNKETAHRLRISPRTVEVHRAHIKRKLGARNMADIMRIVLAGDDAELVREKLDSAETADHRNDRSEPPSVRTL